MDRLINRSEDGSGYPGLLRGGWTASDLPLVFQANLQKRKGKQRELRPLLWPQPLTGVTLDRLPSFLPINWHPLVETAVTRYTHAAMPTHRGSSSFSPGGLKMRGFKFRPAAH